MDDSILRLLGAIQASVNVAFDDLRERLVREGVIGPFNTSQAPNAPPLSQPDEKPENWTQAVLDQVKAMPAKFRFRDVYRAEEEFAKHFPDNRSIMQTVSGVLQLLVNQGVLEKTGVRGEYRRLDDPQLDLVDTVVAPARPEGFLNAVIDLHKWWAIRLHSSMLPKIKYIAFYRVAPISAITHLARVSEIVRDSEEPHKYQLLFDGPAEEIEHIRLVPGGKVGALRNIRYTTQEKLMGARTLDELWPEEMPNEAA